MVKVLKRKNKTYKVRTESKHSEHIATFQLVHSDYLLNYYFCLKNAFLFPILILDGKTLSNSENSHNWFSSQLQLKP